MAPVTLGTERPLSTHAPVLALTLLREVEGRDEVLVGVRTAANGTHANVMSVPTIRVRPETAELWLSPLANGILARPGLDARPTCWPASPTSPSTLTRKLAAGDPARVGQ